MTAAISGKLKLKKQRVLITGGCGFIGCNIASALAERGDKVLILDSLSRSGTEENAEWLKSRHGDRITIEIGDVRDRYLLERLVADCTAVLHLAAQVAVTTSLANPFEDFEINAGATLNVLEAVRRRNSCAPVIMASTNKVYGKLLDDWSIKLCRDRYEPTDSRFTGGVSESAPLDFYSPYGCSKGTADQYVHDYARVFGLRTVVLRMSCIYGPHQFGNEDQGWITHFLLQALNGRPITIYGDGYQVRDALYVDDAVAAWIAVLDNIDAVKGCVFNLGGGPRNACSLREMMELIGDLRGQKPDFGFDAWRPGDQPWYVSDTRALSEALGWEPHTSLREGVCRLDRWLTHRFAPSKVAPVPDLHEARV
jgi:CDP-paratose 2-epimerase